MRKFLFFLMSGFYSGEMFASHEKDKHADKNDDPAYCIWSACGEVF